MRGLQWFQLYFHLSKLFQAWPLPSILVVHLGANDDQDFRFISYDKKGSSPFPFYLPKYDYCIFGDNSTPFLAILASEESDGEDEEKGE